MIKCELCGVRLDKCVCVREQARRARKEWIEAHSAYAMNMNDPLGSIKFHLRGALIPNKDAKLKQKLAEADSKNRREDAKYYKRMEQRMKEKGTYRMYLSTGVIKQD